MDVPECVTQGSYNIVFIAAVIMGLLLLIISSYNWDKLNKAEKEKLSKLEAGAGITIDAIGVLVAVVAILILVILYFNFQKKINPLWQKYKPSGAF